MDPSRDKNARKARAVVGRGEKSLLFDAGFELRLRGSRTRRAKIINGMGRKKESTVNWRSKTVYRFMAFF